MPFTIFPSAFASAEKLDPDLNNFAKAPRFLPPSASYKFNGIRKCEGLKKSIKKVYKIITLRNKFSASLRRACEGFSNFFFRFRAHDGKFHVAHKGLSSIRQIELNFHKIYNTNRLSGRITKSRAFH